MLPGPINSQKAAFILGPEEQNLAEAMAPSLRNKTVAINGNILPGLVNIPASLGIQNTQHINQVKAGLNWHIAPNIW